MVGFFVGAVAGAAQFKLLSIFTKSITAGTLSTKTVLAGVLQIFMPLAVLLGWALLFKDGIMWVGIGMAAALLAFAGVRFVINMRTGGR